METAKSVVDKRSLVQLFLVSFLSLFIELLYIRWMSADIRAFSIFKTFPLVACFIGLGVGCARSNDRWFAWSPLLIFTSVALMTYLVPAAGLGDLLPANVASYNWVEPLNQAMGSWLPTTLKFMGFLVLALCLPFFSMAGLGARIGVLFNKNRPLLSYAADISGALLGSAASSFALILGLDPALLFAFATGLLLIPVFMEKDRYLIPLIAALATLVVAFCPQKLGPAEASIWSPYQHLRLHKYSDRPASGPHHDMYWLYVNGRLYQACWDPVLEKDPYFNGWLIPYWSRCFMPYRLCKPDDVAVVAAGLGMDIKAALDGGAKSIDAVDIDPFIMSLGKELNVNEPYKSPKVVPICDDARHFFRNTKKQYDLVVFSHLDSQTVLGQSSSVRLDNFVYTKESFQRALKILKDNGLLFVCFNAQKDWFRDRMYWTLAEAAGYPPIIFKDPKDSGNWSFFAISGPLVRDHKITLPADLTRIDNQISERSKSRILTDDWPYLYVQSMSVDWTYILISAEILVIALAAGRKFLFFKASPGRWQLFFLGSAFLLLELQAISRLALLFGTTWITSAVVISAILVMILLSNLLVIKFQEKLSKLLTPLYVTLLVALISSYFLQIDQVLTWNSEAPGKALITLVTLFPMFIAGLIFPISFGKHKDSATAFAFNLCGSTIGALLEYQANFTGINSLVLVSAGLYLLSFLALHAKDKEGRSLIEPEAAPAVEPSGTA